MDKIFIRPLQVQDAEISWRWRNDPEVWKFTASKPDIVVTYKIELEWLKKVLKRADEIRFAICIKDSGKYIGNVQLTDINVNDAQFHIFIGDKEYWGRGYGTDATILMVNYGFDNIGLQSVYLDVNKKNCSAINAYEKSSFKIVVEFDGQYRMAVSRGELLK